MRIAAALLAVGLTAAPAAAGPEPLRIPPARVGDAWTIDAAGLPFSLEATEIASAVDRLGREREALLVDVEGVHPITSELKTVTRHSIAVDAASGVSIADVVAWEFAEGSEPGAYASYEPNNPDGWPGWILAGGLLAGRELIPGQNVEVPLVMTSTRGVEWLVLSVAEAPAGLWGRCVHASGSVHYPTWVNWNGGEYRHRTLDLDLTTVVCEGTAYAVSTDLAFSFEGGGWSVHVDLLEAEAGVGEAVVPGPFEEPAAHVLAARAPFDGDLPDGGPLPVWSLEEAQEAAALAPGLVAWQLLHPDGYLVEAHWNPEGLAGDEWRLVYAAPGGDQHAVLAKRVADVGVAADLPQADPYPFPVPALSAWPEAVLTPADALAVWHQRAGAEAELVGLRWEPLLNHAWHVVGRLDASCGDGCTGTVDVQTAFRYDTGAAETGEHPLP